MRQWNFNNIFQPFQIRHNQGGYETADLNKQKRTQGEEKALSVNGNKHHQGKDSGENTWGLNRTSPPRQVQLSAEIFQTAVFPFLCYHKQFQFPGRSKTVIFIKTLRADSSHALPYGLARFSIWDWLRLFAFSQNQH